MAMGQSIKTIFVLFLRKKLFLALSGDKRDLRRDQDNRNENKAVSAIHLNKLRLRGESFEIKAALLLNLFDKIILPGLFLFSLFFFFSFSGNILFP